MFKRELTEIEVERYALALERLSEIASGSRDESAAGKTDDPAAAGGVYDPAAVRSTDDPAACFFAHEAAFLLRAEELRKQLLEGAFLDCSLEELRAQNDALYREILPAQYETCYGNPTCAAKLFGENGQAMSFVYMELRGAIVYAFENRQWDLLILMELLLSIYSSYAAAREEGSVPSSKALEKELYWYAYDYCEDFMQDRIHETLHPEASAAPQIILEADLSDPRYLFRFGEYITDNEIRLAAFLAAMSEDEISSIARTWTEGYRIGFEVTGKDLSIKKTVNIRWQLGFERVVRAAVQQFAEMGLESILYRSAAHIVNKHPTVRVGYYGAIPNPQFSYDHRNDSALYLDDKFVTHRLQVLQQAYEAEREAAAVHGGPAVLEVFGEIPFLPEANPDAPAMSSAQQKLAARYQTESGQIVNRYIKGEERSFTIIAYPVPDIGSQFEQIFRETIRINNLDYMHYRQIQQKLIDALDQGTQVRVLGMNGNETDLTIRLHPLADPERQTNFENCVADVNIPVGEVFTSPLLTGTEGLLHVKQVYLNGLQYRDLRIRLKDGMISEYSCANFEDPKAGRQLMEETILFHHETVPIGEFAIGTNTTAYQVARVYDIADKLPILIAEKTGPHFAFGDTCYSFQEDTAVFNPDGKEIIARDNEQSLLRKTAPEQAYFGCHTDITIPYEELGSVTAVRSDGSEITLLADGRFVLPGTEVLNEPLDALNS